MIASDAMTPTVVTVTSGTDLGQAVRLMLERGISGLPVVDAAGKPVGILTEGDLLRRTELGTERHRPAWMQFVRGPGREAADYVRTHARKVDEVMTRDLVTAEADAPLESVVSLMEKHGIKRVPVVRDGRLVGLVSRADLLRQLLPGLTVSDESGATDDELRGRVEAALRAQRWAPRESLRVTCAAGVVTLEGVILDDRERGAIRVAAENVPGVRGVKDALVWVDPGTGISLSGSDTTLI